jgi:hypothetical protein
MKLIAGTLLLALTPLASAHDRVGDADRACITCHGEQAKQALTSVHAGAGIGCITCHGGNAGEVEAEKAHGDSLRTLSSARASVESCGSCHSDVNQMSRFGLRTDQLTLYWTSQHGERLALERDETVATCTSCHGSHAVVEADDPLSPVHPRRQPETCGQCHSDAERMVAHGLPADQEESFRTSVHGAALLDKAHPAAPSCTSCHGSHGALPPRATEVETTCGQCHSVVQQYYERSPHAASAGAKVPVACAACHGDHGTLAPTTDMFLQPVEGGCIACHSEEGDRGLSVARTLDADVRTLQATIAEADGAIAAAAERGLFLGIERSYLEEARGLLVRARTMTHTLDPDALDDVLNRGQAMVDQTMESLATKHRVFRDRKIFTAIFFAVSVAFAIALTMHARELAGRWRRAGGAP